jgi:hypothetical protein
MDKITHIREPLKLRSSAFKIIDRGQMYPEYQIMGTAIALVAMCDATGIDMRRLIETTERVKRDIDGPFQVVFAGIEAYARNELER